MALTIPLDFTGIQTPRSLGVLSAGTHTATLTSFAFYEDSGRLYAYMQSGDVFHRESFNTQGKGLAFLLAFLDSAGADADKLAGKKVDLPTEELIGKTVWFHYTPPTLDVNGDPVDGSYASYRFMSNAEYDKKMARMGVVPAPQADNGASPSGDSSSAPASGSQGNFDFLTQ